MVSQADVVEIALVGAGPTASSLMERLSANAPELLRSRPLRVHLIDPHPVGTGRIWRSDLHPLLWMNTMAEDATMFTDESVRCDGPVRPGPSLYEWATTVDDATLDELAPPALATEIRGLTGATFPTRLVQSVYLEWFHRRVVDSLPPGVEIVMHPHRAVDVLDVTDVTDVTDDDHEAHDGRQLVVLEGIDEPLEVDSVVLSLGHLDAEPGPDGERLAAFAAEHDLVYLPPGHTADQDLSVIGPGADVIALGFGQAFIDLMILVTEGRGGRFVDGADGAVGYEASGLEPILHVGSRRGVPYRSKLDYRLQADRAPLPRFLDDATIEPMMRSDAPLDFRRDVLPLALKEVAWAYYHELFVAHPERTSVGWDAFSARYAPLDWGDGIDALVSDTVPDPADRFDPASLDRPLAGVRLGSGDDLHRWVTQHIIADVARRTDPAHSADLGAFMGLLTAFGALGRIAGSGVLDVRSRIEDLSGWWYSFFMYYASGPPPQRLRQLLALADAGLVRFIGAGCTAGADPSSGRFVAHSTSHPDPVSGTVLVDARIPTPTVSRSTDPLLRRLHQRGDLVEEVVSDGRGWRVNTGRVVVVGPDLRLARERSGAHPRRHALGVFTNRPAAGAFARPRTNAPSFRQNDVVARSILSTLAAIRSDTVTSATARVGSARR